MSLGWEMMTANMCAHRQLCFSLYEINKMTTSVWWLMSSVLYIQLFHVFSSIFAYQHICLYTMACWQFGRRQATDRVVVFQKTIDPCGPDPLPAPGQNRAGQGRPPPAHACPALPLPHLPHCLPSLPTTCTLPLPASHIQDRLCLPCRLFPASLISLSLFSCRKRQHLLL